MVESISHSALRDYIKCPLLYFYRHVLKLEFKYKPLNLHFGSCLHSALEVYERDQKDPLIVFMNQFTPDVLSLEDKLKHEEYHTIGLKMLQQFKDERETLRDLYDLDITSCERRFSLENVVSPIDGTKLKFKRVNGVIDFETKNQAIGDYKTSSHKYKQEEVDESEQPTIYAMEKLFSQGKLPKEFLFIVFLKKRKKDMIQVIKTTRTKEDIHKLILKMNWVYDRIEKELFHRGHGDDAYCDCYLFDELVK